MILDFINKLISNLGYIILLAAVMTKTNLFQNSIENIKHTKKEVCEISAIFSALGILGTCIGIRYMGSIVNIRNISVVAASIVYGPLIGGISGVVCGLHRYLYQSGNITAIPCSIATVFGGIFSGLIYRYLKNINKYIYGIVSIIVIETLSIILIKLICDLEHPVIESIYVPMIIMNCLGYCIMITIFNGMLKEKDIIEGNQAKATLAIANETLPFFEHFNAENAENICEIIRRYIDAEVVALTDKKHILAHSSRNNDIRMLSKDILSNYTKYSISNNESVILDNPEEKLDFYFDKENKIKSAIITPLTIDNKTIGALKVYFDKSAHITEQHKHMVLGLAPLISREIKLSKIKEYEKMADKAEMRALQSQINPHFLFNALNTITSFIRIDPERARELIVNFSKYLRFNLEFKEEFICMRDEINQIKAYGSIEQARFPGKFLMHYEISENDLNIKIPPLLIEPLVENAIKHGIIKSGQGSNVWIKCMEYETKHLIIVEDDGIGIDEKIISDLDKENNHANKVGLYNVYSRVKLVYGNKLKIERLKKGTRISFEI